MNIPVIDIIFSIVATALIIRCNGLSISRDRWKDLYADAWLDNERLRKKLNTPPKNNVIRLPFSSAS